MMICGFGSNKVSKMNRFIPFGSHVCFVFYAIYASPKRARFRTPKFFTENLIIWLFWHLLPSVPHEIM